jgi:hypothetical protein
MAGKNSVFINNNAPSADDNYLNMVAREIQNTATNTGQSPSDANLEQLSIGMSNAAGSTTFYTDSGTANAYVLTPISPFKAPDAYRNGMEIRFRAGNASTTASTINVAGLGVKDIKRPDGTANIGVGDISISIDITLRFDIGNDVFLLDVNDKLHLPPVNATISGGAFAYTNTNTTINGEGSVDDILDNITGGTLGDTIILKPNGTTGIITVNDNDTVGGNIALLRNQSKILEFTVDTLELIYDGTFWIESGGNTDADFRNLQAAIGYTYLPNGLLKQWGRETVAPGTTNTITLPVTFNNSFLGLCSYDGVDVSLVNPCSIFRLSVSQIQISNGDTSLKNINWFVIGN